MIWSLICGRTEMSNYWCINDTFSLGVLCKYMCHTDLSIKLGTPILIRSNKMQHYEGIYLLQNHSLHVSGIHRTHHQENIKVQLQPLVQVIVSEQQASSNVA